MLRSVTVLIGSDHAGFDLKQVLLSYVAGLGYTAADAGFFDRDSSDDYPDIAEKLCVELLAGKGDRGILICGSGVGVCVAANKIPGIRAGMCHDTYSAHQGVEHDDMNVVVMGARIIGPALAFEVVDSFINAKFITSEERFTRRFKKVLAIEAKYQCGDGSASKA